MPSPRPSAVDSMSSPPTESVSEVGQSLNPSIHPSVIDTQPVVEEDVAKVTDVGPQSVSEVSTQLFELCL